MLRTALKELKGWLERPDRRPLVIRGARQVGKTWLVRELAARSGRTLFEVNLERDPSTARLFDATDPSRILSSIEAWARRRASASEALLFIDEVQTAPAVLAKLRWFAEELPELPVVAAGSLLDFALSDHAFSMPVGRIGYHHLEPMSFEEFLLAVGDEPLLEMIRSVTLTDPLPGPLHDRALEHLRDYTLVGGMPRVVETWRRTGSWLEVSRTQADLVATYRDDFAKYAGRVPTTRLDRVLLAVPRLLGRKFKYTAVAADERAAALRQALELLEKARLCHRVRSTDATGLPLGADVRSRTFKVVLGDVGLASALLGLSPGSVPAGREVRFVNEGGLAEQLVGQALRTVGPGFWDPDLYYWASQRRGAQAELDYVLAHGASVVPIEVKAGKTGTLKSLHLFSARRGSSLAVRFDGRSPSVTDVSTITTSGPASYRLLSLPLYLAGQVHRLIDEA